MFTKIYTVLKSIHKTLKLAKEQHRYIPSLRLIEVNKNKDDDYIVTIQIINKNMTFDTKPEEILAKDDMVDQFSPRDIRTLTYLGYLDINGPKYKILAKRLSESQDKVIFALKKKGEKDIIVKTADEIIKERTIIDQLNANDAHLVGYTVASESMTFERKAKEELHKKIEQ